VAGDRIVEADLGLIQAEAALAEPETLFHRPAQPRCADQPGLAHRLAFRDNLDHRQQRGEWLVEREPVPQFLLDEVADHALGFRPQYVER
jgi:hypothetical protein